MNTEDSSNLQPAVQISNLIKTFQNGAREITVLRSLDLKIIPGEFTAVMGASGSGKSTLLHLLAGLTTPDCGKIEINGRDISNLPDKVLTNFRRKHIGLIFQSYNLVPTLTAYDNIMLPLMLDRRRDVVPVELFERLKINDRLKHRPDQLSGGEQQRIAIARALINQPDVVLADEPTGNLDSITARELGQLLKELNRQRKCTILMVTHDPLVASWADRVLLLKDGLIADEFAVNTQEDALRISEHYYRVMQKNVVGKESVPC